MTVIDTGSYNLSYWEPMVICWNTGWFSYVVLPAVCGVDIGSAP